MKYYVIQPNYTDDPERNPDLYGPFASVAKAKAFLKNQCVDLASSELSWRDDPEKWSIPCHIVQVVETVKQVPVVSVSCRLEVV